MTTQPDAAAMLRALQQRAYAVSFSYKLLEQLYIGTGKGDGEVMTERAAILRENSPDFFAVIKEVLVDNVLLGLAALGDPATTTVRGQKRDNLSIARLMQEVKRVAVSDQTKKERADTAREAYGQFKAKLDRVRPHRNRRIAHADLLTGMKLAGPLDGIPVPEFRAIVESAFNALNAVGLVFTEANTAYDMPLMQGCGESVLAALRRSRRLLEMERWLWTESSQVESVEELRRLILARFCAR